MYWILPLLQRGRAELRRRRAQQEPEAAAIAGQRKTDRRLSFVFVQFNDPLEKVLSGFCILN